MKTAIVVIAVAAVLLVVTSTSAGRVGVSSTATRACVSPEPKRLVVAFIAAFNAGASWRLERIFSPASTFKWYSTDGPGLRLAPDAYVRSTLVPYFSDRHAWGERLTLTSYTGHGNSYGYAHFEFQLVREARDIPPTAYQGKGALICSKSGNQIAVWSMGRK